ncbi:hypothetical protein ABNB59_10950 [Paenibacillus larvae]|uniref:Uncharacterized protein n=3 Tax=Paenibacillus larvae TaxID=1464 RepID=V9W1R5_9BACL|nr:hypothetical protein [Paenibacillus larvae]AHD04946.1 hypothetical protein ERIC2_c11141 [Paenibacillus larvae subsp. larvae DSM 25430]AVF20792.1 hypothetical protein ERICI_00880 [Paenibacillus larvae subsp. larvae]AVF25372.1 hypothetical protein ERICIII_01169 [Paenibacillus larvae subsp. larvae]AVF30149.1 hypothetical protein ERICIV_01190 [Paenibacillus larvae subsp. larvae]AVG11493.1 hypothetical protein ERICII_01075 [Paenibacillus larvae subsp. larvae DSM 25430]
MKIKNLILCIAVAITLLGGSTLSMTGFNVAFEHGTEDQKASKA